MDLKGRLLGNRYEIIEKIGNGGMAMVYKAKCHVLNRYVAVKILRDEFTTDEEFIKRFEIEAQAAASITHPNIVSVYDVGVDGNLHYIVMELIKGKTLKDIIVEEKGPLPWKWSVNIAIQIAQALETAHKNHIIHRDIKPHNIIITEDGVAKVTDFGIAKAVSNSTITAFGSTIGSVHYFSPEHARGGFTDEKSDLYSLGVVMYEMLTGKLPFDADTPVSIALKHMQEEPIEAKTSNPNIPQAVNDVIMKALKKDTNLRYQNATEMLIDLKRSLKDPQGDFVDKMDYQTDCPTQRISTAEIEEEMKKNKENKKNPNKFVVFIKKHKALTTIACLILLFVISLGATIGISNAMQPKEILIPDLTGKTVEEAKQILKDNKLNYVEGESEYNTEFEKGLIIAQYPEYREGLHIKEKTEIKVNISLGTEKTEVPKFEGLTKEEAENAAVEAKVQIEIIEEISKDIPEGIVISQETKKDTEVNAGDIIKIHVSIGTGIKQVVVESVLYKPEADAKKALEALGFKVKIEYKEEKERDNGVVLAQSVNSGEVIDEGSEIILTVNKLAETKTGIVHIDVLSFTGYKEGKVKEVAEKVEKTEETENKEDNAENDETSDKTDKKPTGPRDIEVKIVVDKKPKTKKAKENAKDVTFEITGKSVVTIEVWIDGEWKKDVDMNLNTTPEITIQK